MKSFRKRSSHCTLVKAFIRSRRLFNYEPVQSVWRRQREKMKNIGKVRSCWAKLSLRVKQHQILMESWWNEKAWNETWHTRLKSPQKQRENVFLVGSSSQKDIRDGWKTSINGKILQINFHSQHHILLTLVHSISVLEAEKLSKLEICSSFLSSSSYFLATVSAFFLPRLFFLRIFFFDKKKHENCFSKSQTKLIKKTFPFLSAASNRFRGLFGWRLIGIEFCLLNLPSCMLLLRSATDLWRLNGQLVAKQSSTLITLKHLKTSSWSWLNKMFGKQACYSEYLQKSFKIR